MLSRLTVVVSLLVGHAAVAAGTVLLVPEDAQVRGLAAQVEALLKGAHVRARIASESSPAVACAHATERAACLGEAGRGANVDAVALLTAAEIQGRLAVSLQLISAESGAVIAEEAWRGPVTDFEGLAAEPVRKVAAAVKPARAPAPKTAARPREPTPQRWSPQSQASRHRPRLSSQTTRCPPTRRARNLRTRRRFRKKSASRGW